MTSPHAPLDARILAPGLLVTVANLAGAFADHYAGKNPIGACKACGHIYSATSEHCPTMIIVAPLLKRRKAESPSDVPEWIRKALGHVTPKPLPVAPPKPIEDAPLFDTAMYSRPKPSRSRKSRATA